MSGEISFVSELKLRGELFIIKMQSDPSHQELWELGGDTSPSLGGLSRRFPKEETSEQRLEG